MRGGLSAIQQTLTPEAASVLSHAMSEAARRNHGQTTPLHVAATLLSSPAGFLRQACIRSHPNSSHPLQCRALELCFSVALDRLPTTTSSGPGQGDPHPHPQQQQQPPISNALMAALKRAQAHQRRGCPDQQQQPLLAVKVELEQLIISILDDPSVSRVMREASFSSPAVKAAIEQALSGSGPKIGLRNMYLNPKLQPQTQPQAQAQPRHHHQQFLRGEDVKRVVDILSRARKRNPVLVGESEPEEVVKEVLRRVGKGGIGELKGVEVVRADGEAAAAKVSELAAANCRGGGGVVVDLGDLKWLVDQPGGGGGVSEAARAAVAEIGRVVREFAEGGNLWLVGTATCETYLRCQVYHPTMESLWDLQVVSIVARPSIPGMLPRLGSINGGILSSSVECLSPMKSFPIPPMTAPPPMGSRRLPENLDPSRRFATCPQCADKCAQEVAKLAAAEEPEAKSDASSLPAWLQGAKPQGKDRDGALRQKTQELQKKWSETCSQLHPGFHHGVGPERVVPSPLSMTGLYNPALLARGPFQPKLQQPRALGDALQLNLSSQPLSSVGPKSPPRSPVRTDLALGRPKLALTAPHEDRVKDFLGCISSEPKKGFPELQGSRNDQPAAPVDIDSFKKLLKGLMEKVWWQKEAASGVASTVAQCKSGNGKRRAGGSKGDVWLLFSGPDRIGKKKMAAALSDLVYGVAPILISLGSRRDGDESDFNFRGKTAIDRIADAVRRNPFSVIMLQDIDEADVLVRGNIKRAMERGRLTDSHGREIGLGNVIFVLTSAWVPDQLKGAVMSGGLALNDEKLASLASGGWQLRISVGEKATGKRPPPAWLNEDGHGRVTKQRKEVGPGLSFDLNELADIEDDRLDGSNNSSDLTVDNEDEHGHELRGSPTASSVSHELLSSVDEAIVFKPVDFAPIRDDIERAITSRFSTTLGDKLSLKIEREALEKILSGVWLGQGSVESWAEKVVVPSLHRVKSVLPSLLPRSSEGKMVAWLELDKESESRGCGDWLPSRISVSADAQ